MPDPEYLPKSLRGERHFRWRGGDVSRVEALSDAVFALVLTLLAVSLEVPRSSNELSAMFWQFPAFGICFVFLLWVWYEHFLYHRRFGFEDPRTIWLNGLLLLFVVFFVYPMKFLANRLVTDPLATGSTRMDGGVPTVMTLYSTGFVGIFATFSCMYLLALRRARAIELDELELIQARGSLRGHSISVGIGAASLGLIAFVPGHAGPMYGGIVYFAMGPLQWWNGMRTGRRVDRVAARTPAGARP
jgi:hypothetical protein